MGNRAVVTLSKNPKTSDVGIYLHWNGGAESVLAFAEAARHYGVRCEGDISYGTARIIQIICNFFGGTLSVGCGSLGSLPCNNYDNGVFSVQWNAEGVKMRHWPDGDYSKQGLDVDTDKIKSSHEYWTTKGKDGFNLLESIINLNKTHLVEH